VRLAVTRSNVWRDSPDKEHSYLVKKLRPEKIAAVIEQLMFRSPAKNPQHNQEIP
jgi:hypothetical protein